MYMYSTICSEADFLLLVFVYNFIVKFLNLWEQTLDYHVRAQ